MRILALVTDCFGGRGGIAQYNRDLMSAMSNSPRIEKVVVLPRHGHTDGADLPSKVDQRPPLAGRARFSFAAMELALKGGPFDVVFCGHLYLAPVVAAISRLISRPMWLQVHGVDAWERPTRLLQASMEQAELVTAVSRYTRRRILQWARINPEQVKVLPNTMRFPIRTRDPSATVDPRWAFAAKPYILTVSRIDKEDAYKGHHRVLTVLGELRRRHPDLQYVIVGDGDGRRDLEDCAKQAGVADAVHFVGHIETDELRSLLAAARAFVMPSTKEGFGIVFLEAAAYGLPVIAGNIDGSVDALSEGASGTLIDPDDPAALCDALSMAVAGLAPPPDPEALARFAPPRFREHVDALLDLFAPDRPSRGLRVSMPMVSSST